MSLPKDGMSALQYSTTEGYLPLREYIATRYPKRTGLSIFPEHILITNGSQQCLDLNREGVYQYGRPGGY
jgi:2-aminoadipate transaminase